MSADYDAGYRAGLADRLPSWIMTDEPPTGERWERVNGFLDATRHRTLGDIGVDPVRSEQVVKSLTDASRGWVLKGRRASNAN